MYAKPNYLHSNDMQHAPALAEAALKLAKGRMALYHGTRYAERKFETGVMRYPRFASQAIFFTRDPRVAGYWAAMPGDWLAGRATILVFDRRMLAARYKIELDHFEDDDPAGRYWIDEMEEKIEQRDIVNFQRYLIGVVCEGSPHPKPPMRAGPPFHYVPGNHSNLHLDRVRPDSL